MEREFTEIKQVKVKKAFRVLNLDIETYELIKAYCQKNNLKLSKWVGSEIKNLILTKTN
jgi:hypothetical protein